MEVKIGVIYTPKEINIEVDGKVDEVVKAVDSSLGNGGGPVLWLTDKKGRRVGIAVDKIAYIEIGEEESKRVGFGPA